MLENLPMNHFDEKLYYCCNSKDPDDRRGKTNDKKGKARLDQTKPAHSFQTLTYNTYWQSVVTRMTKGSKRAGSCLCAHNYQRLFVAQAQISSQMILLDL